MMRDKASLSRMRKSWMALCAASLLTTGVSLSVGAMTAQADQSLPTMSAGYQNGKITAVNQTTFQIDGRTYSLTPDAEILDDSGNQLDAGYVGVDVEAKFHVKKDQSDKIDKMILILPR